VYLYDCSMQWLRNEFFKRNTELKLYQFDIEVKSRGMTGTVDIFRDISSIEGNNSEFQKDT